jgi:dCTP deaminase
LQPGWRGSIPLELFNHGNSPVEMVVGSRICQVRLFQIDSKVEYVTAKSSRKYFGAVRPTVSRADKDQELERLTRISKCL